MADRPQLRVPVQTLQPLQYALARKPTALPYIPGLLSFRELPAALEALAQLPERDVISYLTQQAMNSPQLAAQLGRLYTADQGVQGDAQ